MTVMLVLLFLAVLVEFATIITLLVFYLRNSGELKRFEEIADVEAHREQCVAQANAALAQVQTLSGEAGTLTRQIAAQKQQALQYQKLLGGLKTAADLRQRIQEDTARIQQLAATLGGLQRASQLADYIRNQEAAIAQKQQELDSVARTIDSVRSTAEIAAQATYYQNMLAVLKAEVEAVEEARELQEFGFYRPRYNFDSSKEYEQRLNWIRDQQKEMLKGKCACTCAIEWMVDGDRRAGQQMVDKQIKLMLRAFNGECDAAVSKVRYNNVVSLENRIQKAFEQINKLGESQRTSISPSFLNLKIEELHLAHEFQRKKEDEKEAQRMLREQMREEEKAAKEIERALNEADREEEMAARALQKARAELALKEGQQTAKLEQLVARLENELQEALDRKAKAIARAQLTKSGHVYILSNIGAFGEGIYKIGMSRRLEPLERVAELGGASVPFPFDVHAMIYCEDAPGLEAALHRHFADRRVNLINLRREFFRVSLDEIRAAVAEYHGQVTFVTVPEAVQYRETLALRREKEREHSTTQLQIA
jgi:hypothetical protein